MQSDPHALAAPDDEPSPDMTPMIDVVFQLLVFFLVTMKFKTLDMKVEAFLPRHKGVAPTPIEVVEQPSVELVLRRRAGETETRLRIANQTVGTTAAPRQAWGAVEAHVRRALDRHLATGASADDLEGKVDASHLVPTADVIRAVDAFWSAGVTNVTFEGSAPPRRPAVATR